MKKNTRPLGILLIMLLIPLTAVAGPQLNLPEDVHPPTVSEPPHIIPECPADAIQVSAGMGEIMLYSFDGAHPDPLYGMMSSTYAGAFNSPVSGLYHLYNSPYSDSGASQPNESFSMNIGVGAIFENCGAGKYMVEDLEGVSSTERVYAGTFHIASGINNFTLEHYCVEYRSSNPVGGDCPQFHTPQGTTQWGPVVAGCHITDPNQRYAHNSIHFNLENLCLVPAM